MNVIIPQAHSVHRRFVFLFLICIGLALRLAPSEAAVALLHVSSNGRYLSTPSNQPFFLVGDTAWSLALSLTEYEASSYLSTRASQGFNTVFMDAVGLKGIISGVSTDRNGNAPFNGTLPGGQYDVSTVPAPGDTTSSAGRYWQHIDNLISMANSLGIQVMLDVYDTYCPWFSTSPPDGHSPNSPAQLQAYGEFLGERYANAPNIIWAFGNDYPISSIGDADMGYVIQGILTYDTSHLITMETDAGATPASFDNTDLRSYLNVNGVYLYSTGPYRSNYLTQYNLSDYGPIVNIETGYENNPYLSTTPATVRLGHYVMFLSGSVGDIYGNEPVGGVQEGGPFASGWQAQLASQGGLEMSYFATFLASIPWATLVPDQSGLVFSGVGSPTDYSGAWVTDGTLAIGYKPPTGTSVQSFLINMSRFPSLVTARWFDPTAGTYTTIGSDFANSGTRTFTSPGTNSSGLNDWVLVLTTKADSSPITAIDIETLTNGHQADGADAPDVPRIIPGETITWTYQVTNTGEVAISAAKVLITDNQPGVSPVLDPTTDAGGDSILSPGEVWTYTATAQALDLGSPPDGITVVPGCNDGRNTYQNTGRVVIVGTDIFDEDKSHYCNSGALDDGTPPPQGDATGGDATGGDATGGDATGGDATGGGGSGGGGSGGGGSGGGGCTITSDAHIDPIWILILIGSVVGLIRRQVTRAC